MKTSVPQWLRCRWCEWQTSRYTSRGLLDTRTAHLRLLEHIEDRHPLALPSRLVGLMVTVESADGMLPLL